MSKLIQINKELFEVKTNEYINTQNKFKNLKIFENLGLHERLISLIKKLKYCFEPEKIISSLVNNNINLITYNCTHGGFIPIKLNMYFNEIYLINSENNLNNIKKNISFYNINNIFFSDNINEIEQKNNIIFIQDDNNKLEIEFELKLSLDKFKFNKNNRIILSKESKFLNEYFKSKYLLSNTNYYIYFEQNNYFDEIFKFYLDIDNKNILNYDNLINLCVMVKNGGENFEYFLKSNINLIDKWTILDTGSTDNTIKIINDVLVGKKDGQLYQEPFINFRDSRNRLLELAGEDCKFTLMLDDTYIVRGNLRNFLNFVRGDQYSSSFSIYIDNDDVKYSSNRILKSNNKLRYIYKIHEVITEKDNIVINIPYNESNIFDSNSEFMLKRTANRLETDLKFLYEELEEDPNNPRTYYYLGQTYNLLGDYNNSYKYFLKRYEFSNSGFIQERFSAILRAARIANFNLELKWEICEDLYLKANKIDESRPEPLYFIGLHYYSKNNYSKAFEFLKKAFELGIPENSQFDLILNLYYHFIPKFLTKIAYKLNEFILGEKASDFFISYHNNKLMSDYQEILSWNLIYKKINIYKGIKQIKFYPPKPIFCFVVDGGFNQWSGTSILKNGVGGSETYIIEMARNIQKIGLFQTYVFTNTPNGEEEIFEDTIYKPLNSYYEFVNTTYIQHCMISRFSEYLPLTFKGFTENVYFVIHDLTPSGNVIPIDNKLKQIFCLTEWHVEYFTSLYPQLKYITVPFYYGCSFNDNNTNANANTNVNDNNDSKKNNKIPYSFIYSSYPNRGLLELLKMWPDIYNLQPKAILNIYSDVNNKWSNDNEPDKMNQVKNLLLKYKSEENGLGINYHGWVSKNILKKAWEISDIWFYPCTFRETFCLTALEAACTKTFVITNDLAALTNTVGERGIIIKGDPSTENWKINALDMIKHFFDETNYLEKKSFIDKNYNWSLGLTWFSQANKLLNQYILKNNIEYKNKFDIINTNLEYKTASGVLNYFVKTNPKIKNNQEIKILDIFTYTGTNLIYFINSIPNSTGIGIDNLEQIYGYKSDTKNNNDIYALEKSFKINMINSGINERTNFFKNNCLDKMIEFLKTNKKFDFIYIGSNNNNNENYSHQLYTLIMIGWELLNSFGLMGINYNVNLENIINKFIVDFKPKYKIINSEHKVWIEKTL